MEKRLTRAEVPVEMTWNLEDMFATSEAWETEFKAVAELVKTVTQYKGRLHEGSRVFLECMKASETLQIRAAQVFVYAALQQSTDATSPTNQQMMGRAGGMVSRLTAETSFVQSEALDLPDGTLQKYLGEEPGLEPFRIMITRMIETKPHRLHPDTEKTLSALREVLGAPGTIYEISRGADMTLEPATDSQGNKVAASFVRASAAEDADTVLRRSMYDSFTKSLKAYQNTYGTTWGTEVKKNVVEARLRKFESATHMLLDQQEVTTDIYHRLHDVILTDLAPHMRRYAQLRKQVLGLDKLRYCDIEAPLDPEYNPEISFEEGAQVMLEGLSVLGPEYIEIMKAGVKDRWVDRSDNIGKSADAFCYAINGVHPYILMTWANKLRNVLTLSHELGHAGQGVLAMRYQSPSNSRPTMFFVEAPSTINEILVGQHILSKTTDVRKRRFLIMQFLKTYHHNFVRHLIEGELQRRTYVLAEKGQPITASVLSRIQGEILDEFWGGEVEIDDGAKLVWMRQGHYYRGLYPYSYSAGLTIGTAVAQTIARDGAPAAARWVEVLKAGGSKKPLELAKMAGVDMTKPDPIREAVAYVGSLVDEVVKSF